MPPNSAKDEFPSWPAVLAARTLDFILTPRSWTFCILLSVTLTGVGVLARVFAHHALAGDATFVTFYVIVAISAIVCDLRAPIMTLVLSSLLGWLLFAETSDQFLPRDFSDIAQLSIFDISALIEIGAITVLRGALIHARKQNQELALLAAELNHRVKNNITIIISMARQTARHTNNIPEFVAKFTARLQSLSKCNEIITRRRWADTPLREIVTSVLQAIDPTGRAAVHGAPDDLEVAPRAALSLGLVVHELAANAAMHGALSTDGGQLEVAWRKLDQTYGLLDWTETTTSPTHPPAKTGFGTTLIRRLSVGDLGGSAQLDYRPSGLHAIIKFALRGATA